MHAPGKHTSFTFKSKPLLNLSFSWTIKNIWSLYVKGSHSYNRNEKPIRSNKRLRASIKLTQAQIRNLMILKTTENYQFQLLQNLLNNHLRFKKKDPQNNTATIYWARNTLDSGSTQELMQFKNKIPYIFEWWLQWKEQIWRIGLRTKIKFRRSLHIRILYEIIKDPNVNIDMAIP